jgi:hypothetical protein
MNKTWEIYDPRNIDNQIVKRDKGAQVQSAFSHRFHQLRLVAQPFWFDDLNGFLSGIFRTYPSEYIFIDIIDYSDELLGCFGTKDHYNKHIGITDYAPDNISRFLTCIDENWERWELFILGAFRREQEVMVREMAKNDRFFLTESDNKEFNRLVDYYIIYSPDMGTIIVALNEVELFDSLITYAKKYESK